jgi:hypothetical protein
MLIRLVSCLLLLLATALAVMAATLPGCLPLGAFAGGATLTALVGFSGADALER